MAVKPIPDWLLNQPPSPQIRRDYVPPKPPTYALVDEERIASLMADIVAACEKHGVWLSHEDNHGAFLVQHGRTRNWLMSARAAEFEIDDQDDADDR